MKIRELLQTEIWSKRTTRIILASFGIVFVIGFLAFNCWRFVELHWLTAGERNAARVALAQIDALRGLGSGSNEDFVSFANSAKGKVDTAERAGWTSRDESVSSKLSVYLIMALVERHDLQKARAGRQESLAAWNTDRNANKEISSSLHKALD